MEMSIAPTTQPGVAIPDTISEGNEVAKRIADPMAYMLQEKRRKKSARVAVREYHQNMRHPFTYPVNI